MPRSNFWGDVLVENDWDVGQHAIAEFVRLVRVELSALVRMSASMSSVLHLTLTPRRPRCGHEVSGS